MDVRQCKKCGKLYQYTGKLYCYDCLGELDEMFIKVRDFLSKCPNSSIKDIVEGTDVEEKYIFGFLKEERLELINAADGLLKCDVCGSPISTGKYCEKCKRQLSRAIDNSMQAGASAKDPKGEETRIKNEKLYIGRLYRE